MWRVVTPSVIPRAPAPNSNNRNKLGLRPPADGFGLLWELVERTEHPHVSPPALQGQGEPLLAPVSGRLPGRGLDLVLRDHFVKYVVHVELARVYPAEQRLDVALMKPRQSPHYQDLHGVEAFCVVRRPAHDYFFHFSFHSSSSSAVLDLSVIDGIYCASCEI